MKPKSPGRTHRGVRKGWLSGMKKPARGGSRMSLRQWLLAVPVLAVLAGAILLFVYISYLHPKLAQGIRVTRTVVLERTEKTRPDGALDLAGSSLLVRIEGRDVRLAPRQPEWSSVAKGDILEVEFVTTADGTYQPISWKRAPSAPR